MVTDLAQLAVPVLTDPPIAVHAVAGVPFTVPVASIHTANQQATADDFTATIQWGDGQSSRGTIEAEGGGTFELLGSHTYASPGTYPVAINVSDNQGNTVSDSSTATVTAPESPPLAPPTETPIITPASTASTSVGSGPLARSPSKKSHRHHLVVVNHVSHKTHSGHSAGSSKSNTHRSKTIVTDPKTVPRGPMVHGNKSGGKRQDRRQ